MPRCSGCTGPRPVPAEVVTMVAKSVDRLDACADHMDDMAARSFFEVGWLRSVMAEVQASAAGLCTHCFKEAKAVKEAA